MTADNHIEVSNLRICYGNQEVVHSISFAIASGEFVSIVGKSGSGKSSLLHALAGFIDKTGDVSVPLDVGMVFQNYSVFPWLTVKGNIAFGLGDSDSHSRQEVIAKNLEMIGLESAARRYPFQLSGGQVQRVALARALAPEPDAIFMDEPFGALDMFTRERMQKWLLGVWEKNHKTVLFVTHNIEEAVFLSDKVLVMAEGKFIDEVAVPLARPRVESCKYSNEFIRIKQGIVTAMQ